MSFHLTPAEALDSYIVPANPMPDQSEYHDKVHAELVDAVAVEVKMTGSNEVFYIAKPRKQLDLYAIGSAWREQRKNGRSFVVVAHVL